MLSHISNAVVNDADSPPNDTPGQRSVHEADDAPCPRHRIANEKLSQELEMGAKVWSTFEEQPDGHEQKSTPTNEGTHQRQHASVKPNYCSTYFVRGGHSGLCSVTTSLRSIHRQIF